VARRVRQTDCSFMLFFNAAIRSTDSRFVRTTQPKLGGPFDLLCDYRFGYERKWQRTVSSHPKRMRLYLRT
jgi:hypothetical protein